MTLYLDTSVISALFDKRNPERKALTKDFFEGRTADRLLVSELTRLPSMEIVSPGELL